MTISRRPKTRWLLLAIVFAIKSTYSFAQQATESPSNSGMDHSHMPIAAPNNAPIPQLSLALYRDAMSGFNLELKSKQFVLKPPPKGTLSMPALMAASINKETGFIEGHAHLYINGEKNRRVYGNNIHLPDSLFHQGVNQLSITLNNHGHMYWTVNDRKIIATLFINQSLSDPIVYRFESFPIETNEY